MLFLNIIISFIWKSIAYSLPVPLLLWIFKKYGHWSHLGIGITNLLFLFSSIVAFILESSIIFGIIQIDNSSAEMGWMIANIFLYCGFWIIILALLFAQYDDLPVFSHLITVLVGFSIGLILNSDNLEITFQGGQISADYYQIISICAGIMYFVFVILAFIPLIKKILSKKVEIKKKQYYLIFISYSILTFWVISLFLTRIELIRIIRRLSLSLGMFLWAIALYIDPLTIVISKAKVQKAIVITKTGLPIFSYDFEEDKEMRADSGIIAGLLSAIKSGMEGVVSSGNALKTMAFEDSIMNFINGRYVVLLLLSQETISSNTKLIGNIFLENFETRYRDLLENNVVEEEEMHGVVDLLKEVTDSVQL